MFSFSQTVPSSDPSSGSSWDTTGEGAQNFHQDYIDHGSTHRTGIEDFSLHLDGQVTPRGQAQSHPIEDLQGKWANMPCGTGASVGGEPMMRGTSRTSTGSRKHRISKSSKPRTTAASSQLSSHMSALDVTGNASFFANGSQTTNNLDVTPCLFTGNSASGVSSQMLFPDMPVDFGLSSDGLPSPPTEMSAVHVVPALMQLDPDASLSQSPSWTSLSTPETHFTSPTGSPEEAWLPDPLMASPPRSNNGSPLQGAYRFVSNIPALGACILTNALA